MYIFRRATTVSIALILLSAFGVYFLLVPIREKDPAMYRKLVEESAAIHSVAKVKSQAFEPFRTNVQKDIWAPFGHLQLKTEYSTLSVQPGDNLFTLKEVSKNCEGSLVAREMNYCFSADRMRYEGEKLWLDGHVVMSHPTGVICGDHAVLTQESLCLENQVRLRDLSIANQESFAIADLLVYRPDEQTFVLLSHRPNRVLFWQEGLSLSAPEVHIGKSSGVVEGIGDVHFSFDLEEKSAIAEIFSKYL